MSDQEWTKAPKRIIDFYLKATQVIEESGPLIRQYLFP